jgi:hypothetical protein
VSVRHRKEVETLADYRHGHRRPWPSGPSSDSGDPIMGGAWRHAPDAGAEHPDGAQFQESISSGPTGEMTPGKQGRFSTISAWSRPISGFKTSGLGRGNGRSVFLNTKSRMPSPFFMTLARWKPQDEKDVQKDTERG